MSAASWQHGPSYLPFSHTSNSQYGAWTSSPPNPANSRVDALINSTRNVSSLIPTPPSRINDVATSDVSRITMSTRTPQVSKEKFTHLMNKYGTGHMSFISPHDRGMSLHNSSAPQTRMPITNGSFHDSGTDQSRLSNTWNKSKNNTGTTAEHTAYSLPSRAGTQGDTLQSRTASLTEDRGLYRSNTIISTSSDNPYRNKDNIASPRDLYLKDISNKTEPNTSVTRQVDLTPGLSRSNTFHGNMSIRNAFSSYSDRRVSLEKLLSEKHGVGAQGSSGIPDSQVKSTPTYITGDKLNQTSQVHHIPKPPQHPGSVVTGETGKENEKPPVEWVQGNHSRLTQPPGGQQPRPFTPYKPGDYLFRSNSVDSSTRKYATDTGPPTRLESGSDIIYKTTIGGDRYGVLEPDKDKDRYTSGRTTPYTSSERRTSADDVFKTDYTYTSSNMTNSDPPQIISSTPSVVSQKSILKKSTSNSALDSRRSVYSNADVSSLGSTSYYTVSTNPLPPLSKPTVSGGTLKRSGSGKRVTFNLALNRSRHILN